MTPKIISLEEKKMVGIRLPMSLINNKTGDLFRKFMPRKKEIKNSMSKGVYALQQYDFENFTPELIFEKWACVEVSDFDEIPSEMESFLLIPGKYVVYTHKGPVSDFVKSFRYMLQTWLPQNGYKADSTRPHFGYLTEKYLGPTNPESEEEVWIPVK